ncbi:GPI ethanolamine phosphate transferase 2-like [Belonocnema kinseyi]|uniref:GPI ethanolamine phosphate transferase 2-like n=1 Tax=Belonocnema kinseyi TaxID=2817044 RepID=UPI00143CEF06|nr:GPI ethanolamine phosphate transferase 2-like [Belonocnema kinseyi]
MKLNSLYGEKIDQADWLIFTYTLLVALFSIILFLYGFFPMIHYENSVATMNDIPQFVEQIRVKTEELYQPIAKRVVIMVIDALRWSFVTGDTTKDSMPILSNLIENNLACLLQAKVNPPTVTMPRIKALTTGTIPNFIDVILNLEGSTAVGDSVLQQAKNNGHKLVFYGDDTWLKLFPRTFTRHEGTTSFFVTDFTEVDNNVTRHIKKELHRNDWSIMILHYLGLDHIGHVAGPFSPLIQPKLEEMDEIIGQIKSRMNHWNTNNIPSLFIVCGDHGMADSGGHGGATLEETLVPIVTIGASCPQKNREPRKIAQIDLASTLSIILGIPIPSSNLGTVSLDILDDLPAQKKLFVLYYNSKQLVNNFKELPNYKEQQAYKYHEDAVKLHAAWLNTSLQSNEMVEDIVKMYLSALEGMKELLTINMVKYDIPAMMIAIIFLFQVLYIMVNGQNRRISTSKKIILTVIAKVLLWFLLNYLLEAEGNTILYSSVANSAFLTTLVVLILVFNSYLCTKFKFNIPTTSQLRKYGTIKLLLPLGGFLHALSLSSSSFVEEEHQTWYYFWVTYFVFAFYDIVVRCATYRLSEYCRVDAGIKMLLLLLAHRILRNLNSTGDKHAHLPDIADWLLDENHKIGLLLFFILGFALLIKIDYELEEDKFRKPCLLFNISITACIYLRHMVAGTLPRLPSYRDSKGIFEIQVFWFLILIYLSHCALRLIKAARERMENSLSLFLFLFLHLWIMVSALLHRPHNVILLPVQLLSSSVIQMITKLCRLEKLRVVLHIWLGNVFYFYQGNSNSLATLDVAAGYVGLESYIPLITMIFMTINTYSAPVLAYLSLLYNETLEKPNSSCQTVLRINKQYLIWRLVPITVYTVIVTVQRYHLFVWTVFSPKLLYEAVHCAVMYFIASLMQLIFITYNTQHVIYH